LRHRSNEAFGHYRRFGFVHAGKLTLKIRDDGTEPAPRKKQNSTCGEPPRRAVAPKLFSEEAPNTSPAIFRADDRVGLLSSRDPARL
jgi:hypothetical protein